MGNLNLGIKGGFANLCRMKAGRGDCTENSLSAERAEDAERESV